MRESDLKGLYKMWMGIGAFFALIGIAAGIYIYLEDGYFDSDGFVTLGIFIGVGLAVVFIFAILLNNENNKESKNRHLIAGGHVLNGTIKDFARDLTRSVNERHPFVVVCSYIDEFTGIEYVFKSEPMLQNPEINLVIGDSVRIYVNPNNYKENYVDVYGAISRAEINRIENSNPIEVTSDFSNEFFT